MTNRTDFQNSDTKSPDTTTDTKNSLIVVEKIEVKGLGIRLYIEPSPELRFVSPLPFMEEKDLHFSSIIPPYQSYLKCNTKVNINEVYENRKNEKPDEELMRLLPKVGQAVAEVIYKINLQTLK